MHLHNQIHPSSAQFQNLLATYPKGEPIVMINILKFKEKTAEGNETGAAAYARYGQNVLPFMKKVGARLLWRGDVKTTVIGDDAGQPEVVLLVQYPSVEKFVEMTTDPAYLKVANDRTIALEYGGLLASQSVANFL